MIELQSIFLRKAQESLASAEDDFRNSRYNSCANRAYYACFQSAIVALIREGILPRGEQWGHGFVQSQFAGELINKRHRYPSSLRDTLGDNVVLRQRADYRVQLVSQVQAARALRRARDFVATMEV